MSAEYWLLAIECQRWWTAIGLAASRHHQLQSVLVNCVSEVLVNSKGAACKPLVQPLVKVLMGIQVRNILLLRAWVHG